MSSGDSMMRTPTAVEDALSGVEGSAVARYMAHTISREHACDTDESC